MALNVEDSTARNPQGHSKGPSGGQNLSIGMSSRMAAFGSGGDMFEKIYTHFAEKVKLLNESIKTGEKYHVLKLLKQRHGLNYSGVIVTVTHGDLTCAHTIMVEKTGDYPDVITENMGGQRYEIMRTPADALDQKYMQAVVNFVAESLNVPAASVVPVDGALLPNEFDVSNENTIMDVFANAINAIDSEIAIQSKDYTGICIPDILNNFRNGKFFVNLFFNNAENVITDATGMPIRQDICVALTFKNTAQSNNRSVNQGEDSIDVLKVYGYVDFEFSAPVPMQNFVASQKFIPNFIITHIDSGIIPTPDVLLLAVASTLAINEDFNWLQAFRPRPEKKGEIDFNDIGALNVEGNIENNPQGFGAKLKTKAKEFTMADFNKAVQMLIKPTMMISIDLPKAGPDTWITSVLGYAKFNRSQAAITRIYRSLATLIGNEQAVNPNVPIFVEGTNKIHGGFYRTKEGIFDLRNLSNYLAVANFVAETNQQPLLVAQYTNSLYSEMIPSDIRAAERKKFIDNMSNDNAVVKQFYDRVTFTNDFLVMLVNTLKAAGFNPMFTNMGMANEMFQRRSVGNFGGAMLGQDIRLVSGGNAFAGYNAMNLNYNRQY